MSQLIENLNLISLTVDLVEEASSMAYHSPIISLIDPLESKAIVSLGHYSRICT